MILGIAADPLPGPSTCSLPSFSLNHIFLVPLTLQKEPTWFGICCWGKPGIWTRPKRGLDLQQYSAHAAAFSSASPGFDPGKNRQLRRGLRSAPVMGWLDQASGRALRTCQATEDAGHRWQRHVDGYVHSAACLLACALPGRDRSDAREASHLDHQPAKRARRFLIPAQ